MNILSISLRKISLFALFFAWSTYGYATIFTNQTFGYDSADVMNGPLSMVFDQQGNLYVSEIGAGRLRKFDHNRQLVGVINDQLNGPAEMYVHNNVIYVAEVGAKQITELDVDGHVIAHIGQGELVGPRSVVVDEEGLIHVADEFSRRIVVFNPLGTKVSECTNASFSAPNDLVVDGEFYYIVDSTGGSVFKTDRSCNVIASYTGLVLPRSIYRDNGQLLIAATGNKQVVVLTEQLALVEKKFTGQLKEPLTIIRDHQANEYLVTDAGTGTLKVFDASSSALISEIGNSRNQTGYLSGARGMALDQFKGEIYVIDEFNQRIQVFNVYTGLVMREIHSPYLNTPYGIAVDNNYVYVTSFFQGILKFTKSGAFVGSYPLALLPYDISRDKNSGAFYITDWATQRVIKTDPQLNVIWSKGGFGSALGQFFYPARSRVVGSHLYVTDFYNNRIQMLDANTGTALNSFGEFGVATNQGLWLPNGIAVSNDSQHLVTTDAGNNRYTVWKIGYDGTLSFFKTEGSIGSNPDNLFFNGDLEFNYLNQLYVVSGVKNKAYQVYFMLNY